MAKCPSFGWGIFVAALDTTVTHPLRRAAKRRAFLLQRSSGGKGEMRGSLRCATDGETVRCFGRDDGWGGWVRRTTAKARCGDLSTAQRTMRLSVASVEMTVRVGGRDGQLQRRDAGISLLRNGR
jgi:hypothetical protein